MKDYAAYHKQKWNTGTYDRAVCYPDSDHVVRTNFFCCAAFFLMIAELLCIVCALYKKGCPLTKRFDKWMALRKVDPTKKYGTITFRWLISACSLFGFILSVFLFGEFLYWTSMAPCSRWDLAGVSLLLATVSAVMHYNVIEFLRELQWCQLHIEVQGSAVTTRLSLRRLLKRVNFICFPSEVVTGDVLEYLREDKDFYRGWAETYDCVVDWVIENMTLKSILVPVGLFLWKRYL